MTGWSARDLPPQYGRRAVVTGGTNGLGLQVALALARAGAEVVLAARDAARGQAAVARIRTAAPGACVVYETLDLSSLGSVAAFANRLAARGGGLDLLVNNAGVMALPVRQETADGFEMQFGVNHLGHVALTARLLPLLQAGRSARVVCVTSLAHRLGAIDFDDLHGIRAYRPWKAYAQSKLAVLTFAFELQRRATEGGWGIAGLAAHPGWALTDLYANGPLSGEGPSILARLMRRATRLVSHSAEVGALPILFAATAPEAEGGGFYGRSWLFELRGPPAPAWAAPDARDSALAAWLWQVSEGLTGCRFPAD
jgi:NAD(P)-dependent dehydrogenase (short-subunit alcohol dehydrogenase family)